MTKFLKSICLFSLLFLLAGCVVNDDDKDLAVDAQWQIIDFTHLDEVQYVCPPKRRIKVSPHFESEALNSSFKWYECRDTHGEDDVPLESATEREFVCPQYDSAGIRKYYCIALGEDGSELQSSVLSIAYTGLPCIDFSFGGIKIADITKESYTDCTVDLYYTNGGGYLYYAA